MEAPWFDAGDVPLRLEPALALRLPARGAARRRVPVAAAAHAPGDLGLSRASGWARRCARCSTRSASSTSSSSRRTGSTSREADHRPRLRLGRARHGRAPARAARERRARGAPRRHRHERALDRPPPLRRVPPRAGRLGLRLRGRDARRRRARGRRRGAAAVVVRPRRPRRAPRALPGAGARLVARHDPPLERQGRDVRAAAAARGHRAGLPARQRRARGRGGRARARLPRPRRSASSRSSRPARAASASSTRPSTARTSCCTSGPARSRCGSRRRSSCCPTRAGPTCS